MTVDQYFQVRKYSFCLVLNLLIYWLKCFIIKIPKYFVLFWSISRINNRRVRGNNYFHLALSFIHYSIVILYCFFLEFKFFFIFAFLNLILKLLLIVLFVLLLIWIVLLLGFFQCWRVDDWLFLCYVWLCLLRDLLQFTDRHL